MGRKKLVFTEEEILARKLKKRLEKQEYYRQNKSHILGRCAEYKKRNPEANFTMERRFGHLKCESKRRGHSLEIDIEYFTENSKKNCYYCNSLPKESYGSYMDRVDNKFGYIPSNIVPCCNTCNKAKNILNELEFYNFIIKVYNNIKDRCMNPEDLKELAEEIQRRGR